MICPDCGKSVEKEFTEDGKEHVLDTIPHVYEVIAGKVKRVVNAVVEHKYLCLGKRD